MQAHLQVACASCSRKPLLAQHLATAAHSQPVMASDAAINFRSTKVFVAAHECIDDLLKVLVPAMDFQVVVRDMAPCHKISNSGGKAKHGRLHTPLTPCAGCQSVMGRRCERR